jgi:hypothetical protein
VRRIDVVTIGLVLFLAGGLAYGLLQILGFDSLTAGVWSQAILVTGLIGWLLTYLLRALTQTMTYNQQVKDYQEAVLQKRFEELTPEELAQLQAEIEQEKRQSSPTSADESP